MAAAQALPLSRGHKPNLNVYSLAGRHKWSKPRRGCNLDPGLEAFFPFKGKAMISTCLRLIK